MTVLPDLFKDFDKKGAFPTIPTILSEVVHEIDVGRLSLEDLSKLVKKDVSFSIQLLAHANSSMYSMPNRVTSVTMAIKMIGLRPLKALCLSMPLFTWFSHVPGVPQLWFHSRIAALCAQQIAKHFMKLEVETENAETAGLIHDLGKIFLFLEAAEFMQSQIQVADQKNRVTDWEAERAALGVDHCFIGSRFGRKFVSIR